MHVPESILPVLKCSSCEGILNSRPVYISLDNSALCNICFSPERPAARNLQYEAVATLLRFPCKNQDLGCKETFFFDNKEDRSKHEEACDYRQYVCPVMGSSECEWLGRREDMLKHCKEKHSERVMDNPCSIEHDINTTTYKNYLVYAFQVVFLLHTKVCTSTGKIYHAVRLLSESKNAAFFSYNLLIKRNNEVLRKKGSVVDQGCLAIQEPTSLAINIASILDVLGGWDGTKFNVSIVGICAQCQGDVTQLLMQDDKGWWCEKCVPPKRDCMNKSLGCTYRDFDPPTKTHETAYCQQRTDCWFCKMKIARGTLSTHMKSVCKLDKYEAGSTWHIMNRKTFCYISSCMGTVVCYYEMDYNKFEPLRFEMHLPVPNKELHNYKCTLSVTQCYTTDTKHYTLPTRYNFPLQWYIFVKKSEFSYWDPDGVNVCVNITKI